MVFCFYMACVIFANPLVLCAANFCPIAPRMVYWVNSYRCYNIGTDFTGQSFTAACYAGSRGNHCFNIIMVARSRSADDFYISRHIRDCNCHCLSRFVIAVCGIGNNRSVFVANMIFIESRYKVLIGSSRQQHGVCCAISYICRSLLICRKTIDIIKLNCVIYRLIFPVCFKRNITGRARRNSSYIVCSIAKRPTKKRIISFDRGFQFGNTYRRVIGNRICHVICSTI